LLTGTKVQVLTQEELQVPPAEHLPLQVLNLLALLVQKHKHRRKTPQSEAAMPRERVQQLQQERYLLCWYKSTNTDAKGAV
jgi:hypothetical protein